MIHPSKTTKEFDQNKCDSCEGVIAGLVFVGSVAAAVFNDNTSTYIFSTVLAAPAAYTFLENIRFGKRSSSQPA